MVLARQQDQRFKLADFSLYQMRQSSRSEVVYFKMMDYDMIETEKKTLPNIILTITSMNEVYMWYENLASVNYNFNDLI
jgi:hypothetical protein